MFPLIASALYNYPSLEIKLTLRQSPQQPESDSKTLLSDKVDSENSRPSHLL